ncbi:hypothetical protein BJV77DRAFT_690362 [Russula vinacea]|nr:hypothetical protein BJV77DRAFT_690362 [Russula vinacea]
MHPRCQFFRGCLRQLLHCHQRLLQHPFIASSMSALPTLSSTVFTPLSAVCATFSICGLQKLDSGHLSLTLRRLDYHRILDVSTSDIVIDGLHSVIHRMRNIQILHNWHLSLLFSVIDDGYNTSSSHPRCQRFRPRHRRRSLRYPQYAQHSELAQREFAPLLCHQRWLQEYLLSSKLRSGHLSLTLRQHD